MGSCLEQVFHQEAGLVCKKTLEIIELNKALADKDKEIAKLREALEFYANPENWSRRDSLFWECIDRADCKDYPHITKELRLTGGHIARKVIANDNY